MQQVTPGYAAGLTMVTDRDAVLTPQRGYRFRFFGTGSALFVLILKNVLLTLLSLGVYAPWAKTEQRKFVWQNTELHGQRFVYHGTGRELFMGYLKLLGGYAVFFGVPALARLLSPKLALVLQVAFALAVLGLIPFALYWSRAYLLSRTSWRGVRFSLAPDAWAFARVFIGGYLLTLLTLGFYAPVWTNRIHAFSLNRTSFGDTRFRYDGSDFDAWAIAMKGLFFSLITLGIYYFWYLAEITRFRARHTHFGAARGHSRLEGAQLLKVGLIYVFGTTLTLGLAFPWLACYLMQTSLEAISLEGEIDFAAIRRADASGSALGDGLADAMDVGLPL
jgi:uncharacterized membrane protein YjgN (DUF898 family)